MHESFSCYLVQNLLETTEKTVTCQQALEKHFTCLNADQVEQSFCQLLKFASSIENHTRMKSLFSVFQHFVENKILSARFVYIDSIQNEIHLCL